MQENDALDRAMAMVRDLRQRCAWDRVQTRDTLRPYLIEEVHELDHALAGGDPIAIRSEVADLLLHLAWQEGDLVVYMIARGLDQDALLHIAESMQVSDGKCAEPTAAPCDPPVVEPLSPPDTP